MTDIGHDLDLDGMNDEEDRSAPGSQPFSTEFTNKQKNQARVDGMPEDILEMVASGLKAKELEIE